MPRAAVGTPKYLANAMKAKGLQKLRWYCQVCQKQCRDENGFKCHVATESHLRQMLVVGEHAGKHIADFSAQFQAEFVALLSRRFSTNRIKANTVYQEYIQDRHHLHMNSTRWLSLTEFVKHLGRQGIVRVDETDKGFFIAWIDNSPKALAKAEANLKKERAVTSDEQRERMLIAEQIARAEAEASAASTSAGSSGSPPPSDCTTPAVGLLREDAAPVKLAFALSKKASPSPPVEPAPASSSSPSCDATSAPLTDGSTPSASSTSAPSSEAGPLKMNVFKKPIAGIPTKTAPLKMNVFKAAKATASSSSGGSITTVGESAGSKRGRDEMSVAQRLILEEQERKRRRLGTTV